MLWNKSVADYPNTDGWSLIYSLRGPTAFSDYTADNNSDGSYSITLTATVTAALSAGAYKWTAHAYIASPLQRFPVASGVFLVTPNLVGGTVYQTFAETTLTAIRAAITGRIPADFEHYTIGGRQIGKIPIKELHSLEAQYRYRVWRERNPGKSAISRGVSFVNPR